jgi:hypothetical protein
LTESNFTLGALSPESAELIGQLDPVLGSIVAARQTVQESTSALNFGSLLSDGASAGSSGEESIGDLDLGFYFDSPNNRAHEEIENDADDEEEEELVNLIRPESSASNTIDAISEQLEASLEDMIQTAQMHPRSLQVPSNFYKHFNSIVQNLSHFSPTSTNCSVSVRLDYCVPEKVPKVLGRGESKND